MCGKNTVCVSFLCCSHNGNGRKLAAKLQAHSNGVNVSGLRGASWIGVGCMPGCIIVSFEQLAKRSGSLFFWIDVKYYSCFRAVIHWARVAHWLRWVLWYSLIFSDILLRWMRRRLDLLWCIYTLSCFYCNLWIVLNWRWDRMVYLLNCCFHLPLCPQRENQSSRERSELTFLFNTV